MEWADGAEQVAFRKEVREFIEARLPEYYKQRRERGSTGLESD